MSDRNNEVKKSVKNQLFTASVTGVTFEDFSQNAILFPAQDVPKTSTLVNTPNGKNLEVLRILKVGI